LLPSAQKAKLHSVLIILQEGLLSGQSQANRFSAVDVKTRCYYVAKNPF